MTHTLHDNCLDADWTQAGFVGDVPLGGAPRVVMAFGCEI